MNKTLVLISIILLISCSFFNGKEQNNKIMHSFSESISDTSSDTVNGVNCDLFTYSNTSRYITNTTNDPVFSKQDSFKLISYAIEHNQFRFAITGVDTNTYKLLYLLPRIRGIIDTVTYDNLLQKSNVTYGLLPKSLYYTLTVADAVVEAKFISRKFIRNKQKCLWYKTEFLYEVQDVIHSYINLRKGDLILIKDQQGFSGGCNPKEPTTYESIEGKMQLEKNKSQILYLKHSDYYNRFLYRINCKDCKYEDKYCDKAFEAEIAPIENNEKVKNDLKHFAKFLIK